MHTLTLTITRTAAAIAIALAGVGCDEMPDQDTDTMMDTMIQEDPDAELPEGEAVRGEEAPADVDLASGETAPPSEAGVVFFRLMSKQRRNATQEPLCFQPLDNVSGAPVLQRPCNNSPLGGNNPQAFFQTTSLGHRIQYALKDRNSNSDLCLHLAGGVKALSDGAAVVLYQCDGTRPNQLLYASAPDADGAIALMPSHSHRCFSIFGGLDSDQALLYQFSLYTGAASCTGVHQRWFLRTDQGQYPWTLLAPEGWAAPPCVL